MRWQPLLDHLSARYRQVAAAGSSSALQPSLPEVAGLMRPGDRLALSLERGMG